MQWRLCSNRLRPNLAGDGYSCMIMLDVVHPPAVSTALSFAFQADIENNLVLFSLAVGAVALLVGLERFVLWILAR